MRRFFPSLLLFAILGGLSVFFYAKTIGGFPSHIHVWTQSDRYALALGFLDNGFDFLHPQVPNLEPRFAPEKPGPHAEQGITGVDFPIHEYLVAGLMKLLGSRSPGIFRLYVLIFSLLGAWALFRLTREGTGSTGKGLAAAVFLFSAPIVTYYQAGFIPSAPSLAATMIGYWSYFRYRATARPGDFYGAMVFLALAAMARSPFHIFLFALLLQQALEWGRRRWIPKHEALAFLGAYAAAGAWLWYKNYLDKTYGSQFIGHLLTADSAGEFVRTARLVWRKWGLEVLSVWHWLLLVASLAAGAAIAWQRRIFSDFQKALFLQTGLALAGAAVFQFLMIGAYVDHEYYFMDSFYPGLALLFVAGLSGVSFDSRPAQIAAGAVLVLGLLGGVYASGKVQKEKYGPRNYDFYEITRRNFTGADSLLTALNVARDAKILVIDGAAANLPLLLLDRKGYTVLSTHRDKIAAALRLPWDFVAIQDVSVPSEVVYPYPEILGELERVGGNGRVSVYRRRSGGAPATLPEFLGINNIKSTATLDFDRPGLVPGWGEVAQVKSEPADPARSFGFLLPEQPFSPTLSIPFAALGANRALWMGRYRGVGAAVPVKITAVVEDAGGQRYYRDRTIAFAPADGWQSYAVLFPDLPPGATFRCYVWNPERAGLEFDDWSVIFYEN